MFFIIFLGVILFAALNFTFSQGMRSGSDSISEERAKLVASEIMDYGRSIKQAVQMLQINGCSDIEISFNNTVVAGYNNPSAPTDDTCDVFEPEGAGLRYREPETEWLDTSHSANNMYQELYFSSGSCILGIGTDDTPTVCQDTTGDAGELMFMVPHLKEEVCYEIANKMGVLNPTGNIPIDGSLPWLVSDPKFAGVYGESKMIYNNGLPDNSHTLEAKPTACFQTNSATTALPSGTYVFYQVLIAR